jgi:hypothetical protein
MQGTQQQKEKFHAMVRSWMDQFANILQSTDTKEYIQVRLLDPFMKHIIGQIFPYMLIALCLFAVVLILVIMIFVLLLFKSPAEKMLCPACAVIKA